MHINLPDHIATADLLKEMATVVGSLEGNGVATVADIRITLRAFNHDNREYYPPNASGHHDMGFTIRQAEQPGFQVVSWAVPGSKPEPDPEGLRGLAALLYGAKESS